ncbi:MAG: T9SS type A sorting domain-containing protein [Bacteroidetes bacterium]|nr:T9SS type A sorting domain-containing protein [Bacteroidota bacterium]
MKKTITLFLGVALFTNTNAQLVAKYTFTNSNANNEASSGNNGTVTGATLATDRFGNTNKAYAFNGTTSQRIDFGDVTAFNNASQYTISMWLNQTQLDVIGAFWSKSKSFGGTYNSFIQGRTYNDGNLYYSDLRSNGTNLITNASLDYSTVVSANQWFHYAVVYDGTQTGDANVLKTYINGVYVANGYSSSQPFQATTPDFSGSSFIIGQGDPTYFAGNGWNGKIDDIYIFSNALSAVQIDSLKNLPDPSLNTAVAVNVKYTFDNGNANNDLGTNNHGTVTGATLTTDRFGNTNKAYAFDGTTSQRIDFGDVTAFNNVSKYTISMWLNQTQLDVIGAFWSKSKSFGGTYNSFIQGRTYNDGNLYYSDLRSNGTNLITNASLDYSTVVSANQWFHYAVVYDGTQTGDANVLKTYINGVYVANGYSSSQPFQATTPDFSGSSFIIGQGDPTYFAGNGWNGKIDDIYVITNALSAGQIDSLKNLPDPMTIGVSKISNENKYIVYPNPANEKLFIQIEPNTTVQANLISIEGKILKSFVLTDTKNSIDIKELNQGFYTLSLTTEVNTYFKKFIKQ